MIPPYPVQWPEGQRRSERRRDSQFRTSLSKAMENVHRSLTKFGEDSGAKVTDIMITSNAAIGNMRPADPAVAVWFRWDGDMRCIAVDRYPKVEDNLQAIHHVIEARRTEVRHAGIEVARRTFRGFRAALPGPDDLGADPFTLLGLARPAREEQIRGAWRERVRKARLDGKEDLVTRLNIARDKALAEAAG